MFFLGSRNAILIIYLVFYLQIFILEIISQKHMVT